MESRRKRRWASPPKLIAGMPHGAIDIRVHARVVERTGEDGYRDRTCRATAEVPTEIAALPGGDTTDDQPDGQEQRSYVHPDLLRIRCGRYREAANPDCRSSLSPASRWKLTRGRRYRVQRARVQCLF